MTGEHPETGEANAGRGSATAHGHATCLVRVEKGVNVRKNFALSLVLALVATIAVAHHPGQIKINAAVKKQAAVPFNHGKHADVYVKDCTTCHHMDKGLSQDKTAKVKGRKCSTCHLKAQGKMSTMADMSLTRNPMHAQCISCHKTQKKGPTACTACHKKG